MLCLDLSEFPLATREAIGTEKALLLKEILDRIEIPSFEEVPDAALVAEKGLTVWTIPNTELTMVRVEEGPRSGAFLFSAQTVALLEQFYALAESLPYKPGASIGAYEDFLYGPGSLLPRAWIDGLPSWSYMVVAEQTTWQWIGLVLLIAIVICATAFVYRCGKWWDDKFRDMSAWAQVGRPLTSIFVILAMPFVSLIVDDAINITGVPFIVVEFALDAVSYVAAAWLAAQIISGIGEGIINARRLSSASLNSQLIRTVTRLISIVVVIYVGVVAAESFGVPVAPLIAGLGVGGLAIALAVKPTLENIIGGFILFADKPVRVGDFCSFGDKMATVEEIGLRSTRLRALDRTIVTVPNAEFANMQLVNWASCDTMLIRSVIGLRYETKPEQLRYVLAKLREMFFAHPKIDPDSLRIRFVGYGASSQDIQIRVYAMTRDWSEYYAIQEDVFLRVGEIVHESGTSFAFPSQTLYVGRDQGIDEERSAAATQQVQHWRKAGQLPFPRMSPAHRERLANTLDYPPRGSPDALHPEGLEAETAEPLSKGPEPDSDEETREQK
jgi:MscS family membrane protein